MVQYIIFYYLINPRVAVLIRHPPENLNSSCNRVLPHPPPSPAKQGKVSHEAVTRKNPVYLKIILKIVFKNKHG